MKNLKSKVFAGAISLTSSAAFAADAAAGFDWAGKIAEVGVTIAALTAAAAAVAGAYVVAIKVMAKAKSVVGKV